MSLQYQYIVAFVNSNYGNRFINSYTSLFATLIITGVALFAVLSRNVDYLSVDSAYLGLVLTWGFQVSQLLSMAFVLAADLEQAMNAVIRVLQYIDNNPQEAEWNAPKAPEKWPVQADYDIKNISYKYRENLPHVINSISLQIAPREKIGVVGRTGAGKSTIALGLLRIIEISEGKDKTKGKILMNDVNISEIGLHQLRNKCAIIPQDPVLFTGSVRSNIDPFGLYKQENLINVLKQVQIWDQLILLEQK